jgi:hypothetical protein
MCMYDKSVLNKIYYSIEIFQVNPTEEQLYLVDSCTTNSTLKEIKYFQTLTRRTGNILAIVGHNTNIVCSGPATIVLPMAT